MPTEEDLHPDELSAAELECLARELGTDLTREQLLAITVFIREAGDLEGAQAILAALTRAA